MKLHTLRFSISTLYLLVHALLDFSFQNPRSLWFVKVGDFEEMSCIQPSIVNPPHDHLTPDMLFIDVTVDVQKAIEKEHIVIGNEYKLDGGGIRVRQYVLTCHCVSG